MSTAHPPKSVTHFGFNLVGVAGALVALWVFREARFSGPNAVLLVCAAGVLPILLLDVVVLRVHRRQSTGLDWNKAASSDTARGWRARRYSECKVPVELR